MDRFYVELTSRAFESEPALALRDRLARNRDKLFTFIHHDGVPWNNNNAENAIKQFAYYRQDTVGILKESGLKSIGLPPAFQPRTRTTGEDMGDRLCRKT